MPRAGAAALWAFGLPYPAEEAGGAPVGSPARPLPALGIDSQARRCLGSVVLGREVAAAAELSHGPTAGGAAVRRPGQQERRRQSGNGKLNRGQQLP